MNQPAPENQPLPRTRLRQQAALLSLGILVFALALAAIAAGVAWLRHGHEQPRLVSETSAGRVQQVHLLGGLFSRGLVETDSGYYALEEGVSLDKGESLTVQERSDHSRHLCDARRRCTPLLRSRL